MVTSSATAIAAATTNTNVTSYKIISASYKILKGVKGVLCGNTQHNVSYRRDRGLFEQETNKRWKKVCSKNKQTREGQVDQKPCMPEC